MQEAHRSSESRKKAIRYEDSSAVERYEEKEKKDKTSIKNVEMPIIVMQTWYRNDKEEITFSINLENVKKEKLTISANRNSDELETSTECE
jgi:hypothetical protein